MAIVPEIVINLTNEDITLVDVQTFDGDPVILPAFDTQPGGVPVDLSLLVLDVDLTKSFHLQHLYNTGKIQVNSTFLVSQLQAGTMGINNVTVLGTPTVGQAPIATSPDTAVWQDIVSGGGTPGGVNGDFQINNSGAFGPAPMRYGSYNSVANEIIATPASGNMFVQNAGSTNLGASSFGLGNAPTLFTSFARGTPTSPLPVSTGDTLGVVSQGGYNPGAPGAGPDGFVFPAYAITIATEAWTPTANGAETIFVTTPTGSTTSQPALFLQANQDVSTFGNLSSGTGLNAGTNLTVQGTSSLDAGNITTDGAGNLTVKNTITSTGSLVLSSANYTSGLPTGVGASINLQQSLGAMGSTIVATAGSNSFGTTGATLTLSGPNTGAGGNATLSSGSGSGNHGGDVVLNANGGSSNGSVIFQVGGSEAARVSPTGYFGIGTATPLAVWHVRAGIDQNLFLNGTDNLPDGVTISSVNDANNANLGLEIRSSTTLFSTGGISVEGSNQAGASIYTSGRIGVGTAAPSYSIDSGSDINTSTLYRVNGAQISSANLSDGPFTNTPPAGISGDLQMNNGAGHFAVAPLNYNGSTLNISSTVALSADGWNYLQSADTSKGIKFNPSVNSFSYPNGAGPELAFFTPNDGYLSIISRNGHPSIVLQDTLVGIHGQPQNSFSVFGTSNFMGDMGVNTSTPAFPLDVNGNINTNAAYLVNGSQISSTNLADGATLLKRDANYFVVGPTGDFASLAAAVAAVGVPTVSTTIAIQQGAYAEVPITITNSNNVAYTITSFPGVTAPVGFGQPSSVLLTYTSSTPAITVVGPGSVVFSGIALNNTAVTPGVMIAATSGAGVELSNTLIYNGFSASPYGITVDATSSLTMEDLWFPATIYCADGAGLYINNCGMECYGAPLVTLAGNVVGPGGGGTTAWINGTSMTNYGSAVNISAAVAVTIEGGFNTLVEATSFPLLNITFPATIGAVPISSSSSGLGISRTPGATGGPYGLEVQNGIATVGDGVNTVANVRAISYGNNGALFTGLSAGGTEASPTASQAGDLLLFLGAKGFDTTNFNNYGSSGQIRISATENFTPTAHGTQITFQTTPQGSLTHSNVMVLHDSGLVSIVNSLTTPALQLSTGATAGYVLTSDGSGNASWQATALTPPAGATGSIQYNNGGVFGGNAAAMLFDGNNISLKGVSTNAVQSGNLTFVAADGYNAAAGSVLLASGNAATPNQAAGEVQIYAGHGYANGPGGTLQLIAGAGDYPQYNGIIQFGIGRTEPIGVSQEYARFDLYGRFGINTTTPNYLLDVNGDVNTSGVYRTGNSGYTYGPSSISGAPGPNGTSFSIIPGVNNSGYSQGIAIGTGQVNATYGGLITILPQIAPGAGISPGINIQGNQDPNGQYGGGQITLVTGSATQSGYNSGNLTLSTGSSTGGLGGTVYITAGTGANSANNGQIVFTAAGSTAGYFDGTNGNLVINHSLGVGAPTNGAKLYVDGQVSIADGTQASGYIFTSDASGNGSWRAPTNLPTGTVAVYSGFTGQNGSGGVVFDGQNIWVGSYGVIYRADLNGNILHSYPIQSDNDQVAAVAFDGTNVWTCNQSTSTVTILTPSGSQTTYGAGVAFPESIAFDGKTMWVVGATSHAVSQIGLDGTILNTYSLPATPFYHGIAFDGTNMWIVGSDSTIKVLDPNGSLISDFSIGAFLAPSGIAFDGVNMWVTCNNTNSVAKITPAYVVTTYGGASNNPQSIAFDGQNMWTNNADGSVSRFDSNGGVTNYASAGGGSGAYSTVAFDGTNIWVTSGASTIGRITSNAKLTSSLIPYKFAFASANSASSLDKVVVSGTPTSGQVLTATSSTAANWQTPSNSSALSVTTQTSTYTALSSDNVILCNASSGSMSINLPAASGLMGHVYNIKKIDSSVNTVTIMPNGSDQIDNASSVIETIQYQSYQIVSDGTNWWVI